MSEIGLTIAPRDVVLNCGDAHGRRLSRGQFGEPFGGLVEDLESLAEGEPYEVPSLVPIDHVLLSKGMRALRTESVTVQDTDHRALVATIAVSR